MSEWKEYSGSDAQIAEINNAYKNGYILKTGPVNQTLILKSRAEMGWYKDQFTHYLICNPHPLVEMICQQARTGQTVWIKVREFFNPLNNYRFVAAYDEYSVYVTTTPDWNIPGAEYSFEPFEEEV